jgi:hypothetical protein
MIPFFLLFNELKSGFDIWRNRFRLGRRRFRDADRLYNAQMSNRTRSYRVRGEVLRDADYRLITYTGRL